MVAIVTVLQKDQLQRQRTTGFLRYEIINSVVGEMCHYVFSGKSMGDAMLIVEN
jgi:hypothetical protein